jgi:uncharacterized protein DUF6263
MIQNLSSIGLAAVAVLSMPCFASAPVDLVYKFATDKPMAIEMVQEMTQDQNVQGQSMQTSSTTTTRMKTKRVKLNEDGSVLINNTTESIKFTMSAPGTDMSYDSTNPADESKLSDPTIASVGGLVGMEVQLLIAGDGTVLDVPNIDDLKGRVDAMTDPAVKAGAGMMADKSTIIATNEMNYKLLPSEAVEVGDEWTREFIIPFALGSMTMNFDLTLDGVKAGIASISMAGTMSMAPIENQGVTITMTNALVEGSIKFNIEEGTMDLMDMTTTMDMTGSMAAMPDPILTMKMTQKVKSTRLAD